MHAHRAGGAQALGVVEVFAVGRVEVGVEEANPIPGRRGDGEGGELLRGRHERKELGSGGVDPFDDLGQDARGEHHVVVDQQGEGGFGKGGEDRVPTGGDTLIGEGSCHPHLADAGGGLPFQCGQQLAEGDTVGEAGGNAVVDDGQCLDRMVETLKELEKQVGPVEDRNAQKGQNRGCGGAGGDSIQLLPEVVNRRAITAEGGVLGETAPEIGIGELAAAGGGREGMDVGLGPEKKEGPCSCKVPPLEADGVVTGESFLFQSSQGRLWPSTEGDGLRSQDKATHAVLVHILITTDDKQIAVASSGDLNAIGKVSLRIEANGVDVSVAAEINGSLTDTAIKLDRVCTITKQEGAGANVATEDQSVVASTGIDREFLGKTGDSKFVVTGSGSEDGLANWTRFKGVIAITQVNTGSPDVGPDKGVIAITKVDKAEIRLAFENCCVVTLVTNDRS